MYLQIALLGGLLLAGHTSANPTKFNSVFQRSDDIDEILRRDASMMATLTRRQDANSADTAPQISTTPASGDAAKADLVKWEEETKAACSSALMSLNGQASNAIGLAVCYNLPFLDNTTGVFQAELRMYNISAPINPWDGVTAADISMTMSYKGATLQEMNGTFAKRGEVGFPPIRLRDVPSADGILVERQNAGAPVELKVMMYVGQINSNLMGSAMTQAALQPLLVPQIELTAKSPSGADLKATLSSQEASFVNGIFAKQAATSTDPAGAAASASQAVKAATAFQLPGTNLAFFPIGLVVTLVWTGAFLLAVGFGTLGRIQFREQYRRRMRREVANGMRTI